MTQQVVVIQREDHPSIHAYVEADTPKIAVSNLMQQLWDKGYIVITTTGGVAVGVSRYGIRFVSSE